ncbi:MAG: tetratricopeptide repeat protein [Dissulfurispiraceae bacterium]
MEKMHLKEIVDKALACHRIGNLKEARLGYEAAVNLAPKTSDLWHLLGKIALQEGRDEDAIPLIVKAIGLNDRDPQYHASLAIAYQNRGRNIEAIKAAQNAVALDPENIAALNAIGNALAEERDYDQAAGFFLRAIDISPSIPEIRVNLGNLYSIQGKNEEAAKTYRDVLSACPDQPAVLRRLGKALQACEDIEGAVDAFLKSQKLDPTSTSGYGLLGDALILQKNYEAALECYKQSLVLDSQFCWAYYGLGKVFLAKEMFEDARAACEMATQINPQSAEAFFELGNVMREIGMHHEAISAYTRALELKPDCAEVLHNISNVYFDMDEVDAAVESCRIALSIDPSLAEAHWNMSSTLLAKGEFLEGWKLYEWRLKKKGVPVRRFPFSRWDGSSLKDKSILVLAEQGVGDEIMFSSCLSEVVKLARLCIVECDKRLIPLFSRSFPDACFIERFDVNKIDEVSLPRVDFRIEVGSIPSLLRPSIAHFPKHQSYLIAEEAMVISWKKRFRSLGNGISVGISWRGGTGFNKRRRFTPLDLWKKLFSISGCHFINLQYGDCSGELQEVYRKFGVTIHDWAASDPLKDLDDFAAKVAALDLVISADNSTVHMSGALGVPTWVLLPKPADWRWLRDFEDTPWYSTVRLFRQTAYGDWEDVFDRVQQTLEGMISNRKRPFEKNSEKYSGTLSVREET